MLPRWSRLALAAILTLGAAPATGLAAPAEARLTVEDAAGPVVVLRDAAATHGVAPLVAAEPTTCARALAPSVELAAPVTVEPGPAPGAAPWRLAPKTSPPG